MKSNFYIQFWDETVEDAVKAQLVPFKTLDDAIYEAHCIEYPGTTFKILDSKLNIVFEGKVQ